MDTTLTIRLTNAQDKALTHRAHALGKTKSELVRELIDRGLEEVPLGRRISHLQGKLEMTAPKSAWQRKIKERNWR